MSMTPEIAFLLILAGTLLWIMIPFVPALLELFYPRDAAPLVAVGNDTGMLTFFAGSFTAHVVGEGLLGEALPKQLRDGSVVRTHSATSPLAASRDAISEMVVLIDDTVLPDGMQLSSECLARTAFRGGSNSSFRAVLGMSSVTLGAGTTVQRWVHASGILLASRGSRLLGRATSDAVIQLEESVQFDRLDAPTVRVGSAETMAMLLLPSSAYEPFIPEGAHSLGPSYWRVTGDFVVPAGRSLSGSLIVRGNLLVSDGACIEGAVKAHGTVHIARNVVLKGAVAARGRITIEDGARLTGPIISESEIVVGAAVVGSLAERCTVTAPRVHLQTGATVHGAVMTARGWT